ncbi:protein kinase [bacterium]|nr:protein kinase [bacterium]
MQKFGRYEIIEEIGRGGMAVVYLARDIEGDAQEIALKVLQREYASQDRIHARFTREVQTISKLKHPAIVPVFDNGEVEGRPYLIMRHMSGGSLKDLLSNGPLDLETSNTIIERISGALQEAHEQGVVHRDIKPGNILFDENGQSYLADFGIAKVLLTDETTLTATGVGVGTPSYMSPEQIQGRREIDARSDIYSMGVVLFEMLTGKKPYAGETPIQVIFMQVSDPIPDILEYVPELPEGTASVIYKAMAKAPEERYQRVNHLVAAVREVVLGERERKRREEEDRIQREKEEEERRLRLEREEEERRQAAIEAEKQRIAALEVEERKKAEAELKRKQELEAERERQKQAELQRQQAFEAERKKKEEAEAERLRIAEEKKQQQEAKRAERQAQKEARRQAKLEHKLQADVTTDELELPIQKKKLPWWAVASIAFVVVGLGGFAWIHSTQGQANAGSAIASIEMDETQVDGAASLEATLTLSASETSNGESLNANDLEVNGRLIAFSSTRSGSSDIWTVDVDSGDLVQLTDDSNSDTQPDWSPDGSKLVYFSVSDASGGGKFWMVDYDGNNLVALTEVSHDNSPSWSPDGTKIAFISTRTDNVEIWVMDSDGSNLVQLTDNPAYDRSPTWSPDSIQIAFQSDNGGPSDIWVMNVDGSNLAQLTDSSAQYFDPVWSPDGSRIAFYSDRSGYYNIWVMDADGSNLVQLTDSLAGDYFPTWSPDSSQIAFQSYRGGQSDIWIMDADGSNLLQLTDDFGDELDLSWQPASNSEKENPPPVSSNPGNVDANKIIFSSDRSGNQDIWSMNSDGTNLIQLTNDSAMDVNPISSPDGSKILFYSYRSGNLRYWMMNSDGSNQFMLADEPGFGNPVWSPNSDRIVFNSYRMENIDLWVVNVDGSNLVDIFNSGNIQTSPYFDPRSKTWLPDGSKLIFTSIQNGNNDILMINADGIDLINLTDSAYNEWAPSLSSDGSKIAFISDRSGKDDIWVMDADGSNLFNLTYSIEFDISYNFAWSPVGSKIAFQTDLSDIHDILVIDVDGSNLVNLTNSTEFGISYNFAWSPDGSKIAFQSDLSNNNDIWVINSDGSNLVNLSNGLVNEGYSYYVWSLNGDYIAFKSDFDGQFDIWVVDVGGGNLLQLTDDSANETYFSWLPITY